MDEVFTGYRRDLENIASLHAEMQNPATVYAGDIDPKELGKPIGLVDVIKRENQGQMNSCGGNSISTIAEACIWLATGGQTNVQLSRMFAYVNGQKYCGISGDNGLQLYGGIKGMQVDGCCLESFAPYTGSYYTQFSAAARKDALNWKLGGFTPVTHVDQVYEGLAKRIGGLYGGINWTNGCRNPQAGGFIDEFHENAPQWGQIPGGFHAIAWLDWCNERDAQGYPRLRMFNSHGQQYGDRGTAMWSRQAMQSAIAAPNSIFFFLSDMQFIKPRFDFRKQHWIDCD